MANINTTKNPIEIRKELRADGIAIEYIIIDGVKCGILGSANATDREKAIKAIEKAYIANGGDIYRTITSLMTVANLEEKQIEADEVITISGKDIIISYADAKAYTMDGKEVANCADLPEATAMPKAAIKAILEARVAARK
jgi:methionine synthase I (cobalamin-dependent)